MLMEVIFRDRADRRQNVDGGVAKEDVDRSELFVDLRHESIQIGKIGDVALNADGAMTDLSQGVQWRVADVL
jgi:hypothetical protein